MSEELAVQPKPVVMDISSFSGLDQKLNFLALGIKDQKDAETKNVYIECYSKEVDGENVQTIRFSTDLYLWTEIHPVDKKEGKMLLKNLAVNLFDLYNVIDNCKDSIISMWIDESDIATPKLVVNSYYDAVKGYDELEVKLNITDFNIPMRVFPSIEDQNNKVSFDLNAVSLYTIIKELNTENKTDGIVIYTKDHKIRFQSNYNGLKTDLVIKEYNDLLIMKDFNVFIPFYVFNLMASTGSIDSIKFDVVNDKYIIVSTNDYKFAYAISEHRDIFSNTELIDSAKDYLVVDPENMLANIQLMNRINKPAKISVAKLERVDKDICDMTIEFEGRYVISVRVLLAMLEDQPIHIDSDILESIFNRTNVDAIKIKYIDVNTITIKYENALFVKEIVYDHVSFMAYRNK